MFSIAEAIGNYDNPRSLGSIMRQRRAGPLIRLVEKAYAEKSRCSILDLGGTENYWNILDRGFLRQRRCHITLLNISQTAVRDTGLFESRVGDATITGLQNGAFDIVHANSVIEHVGGWPRMRRFSAEVRRLAPRYFVQTPNFWFPWEPHFGTLFFHYLPTHVRASMLLRKRRGFFEKSADIAAALEAIGSVELLDARAFAHLFPDARLVREKFLGLTKSLIAIRE